MSGLMCSNINDSKILSQLILIFPQENISSNIVSKLAEFLLNHANFEKV